MPKLRIILQSKLFLIVSLCLIIIYALVGTKVIKYNSSYNINDNYLEGKIVSYKIDGNKLNILLKAQEKVEVIYYINTLEEQEKLKNTLKYGLTIKLTGTFSIPLNNTLPNTFNYKKYLYNKRIYYIFTAKEIKISSNKINILAQIKNKIRERIETFNNTQSYMYAFILGENDYIEGNIYEAFKDNGITHLFAVSGMHVSFLVTLIQSLLKRLKLKEQGIDFIIVVFLFFYMFLVGFSASVVRASLLFILILINKKLNLKLSTERVLYILFLMLVIIEPFYIYDLGFQYSFITSLCLILFGKKIKGNYFKRLFLISLIALLGSLPITLANFYEFNLLTVLNNIIIVPLVSLILFPLTLLTFILPFLEEILSFGFKLLENLNIFLEALKLNIVVPKINILEIVIYYIIGYFGYKYNFKYVLGIGLLILVIKFKPYLDFNSYVYYLDVGQGDSSLIVSANRKDVIMIDTGGEITYKKEAWEERNKSFNLGTNIVLFLKSLGITKLDLLVISHGDLDHLGYAETIIKDIEVKQMMFNNNLYNNYEEALSKNRNIIKNNYKGKNLIINNLNSLVNNNENDSSLVLNVHINNYNLLYMGDAPKKVEQQILEDYNLNCTILKLGHHGSNTSSDYEFLKALKPQISIISAGRNNRYNHPSKETLDNLEALNLQYYTTQTKGTIKVKLTNNLKNINFIAP